MRRLVLLCWAAYAYGQAGRAELFGTVEDPSGRAVPQASVEAVDSATSARYTGVTSDAGWYHLLGLPSGQYALTIAHAGFRTHHRAGVALRAADRASLDIRLEIGEASQFIDVTAAAPLLEANSGEAGFHLDQASLERLPLDGRNFVPLVALAPGVTLPSGSLLPRINGSRPRTNEYLYDGIGVLQPEPGQVVMYPVIDGIAEFRVNLNSYSPEYGRSNGGTVLVIGKSGGNLPHGSLYEFLRNEALNARNLFAPPGPKPEFRRNQYGASFGGPILKNKTFFFADWQGTRLRTGLTRFSTVPTLAQRNGVFAGTIFDPATLTRPPFSGNTIPLTRIDSVARQVLEHYPSPNLTGPANNFVRTAVEPDNQDQFDARLDHSFTMRHRAFARYSHLADDDSPVAPLAEGSGLISSGAIGNASVRAHALASGYDWSISPTSLNQARFGYSRRGLEQRSLQQGGIAVPGIPANSFSSVLPTFAIAGFQQIGPTAAANSNFTTSVTQYLDTLSLVRGRHTVKLGIDVRRQALDVLNPANPTGQFTLNTTGTNSAAATGGNAIASLLLGQVNAFSIDVQRNVIRERAHSAEFFMGDEWRVSNRLSLNFGTRYTLNLPSTEVDGQGAVFNLQSQVLEFPRTARRVECCDFGPRVGLAYKLGESLVIRSGYGMIWFEQSGITTPFTLPQFPFIQTVGQQSLDNVNAAFALAAGPLVQVSAPNPNSGLGQGVFGAERNNGSGYSQQWNLTLQKTWGTQLSFETGYLGSKNTRLGIPDFNINQLAPEYLTMGPALLPKVANPYFGAIPASSSLGGATIARQQLLRPFPRFTTVALFRDNVGNSNFHAAMARLEKRLGHGLSFSASYTFSKLIDDASSVFSQTIFSGPVLNNTGAADAYNRHLEKDVSSGDIPQVFALGFVYQIPRWRKLSGWELSGLVRVQVGDAVAVTQATNLNSSLGFAVQRPNRTANPNDYAARTPSRWFDTGAFSPAAQFEIGTSSRNPVRGPGLRNADLMLGKMFRLTERANLEVRAEVFNVSNTPAFSDPNGSFGSAAFGTITSAGNPRVFEFAAKLRF